MAHTFPATGQQCSPSYLANSVKLLFTPKEMWRSLYSRIPEVKVSKYHFSKQTLLWQRLHLQVSLIPLNLIVRISLGSVGGGFPTSAAKEMEQFSA